MTHQSMRQGKTATTGTTCPTPFNKFVGSLTFPANHVTLKMQETGLRFTVLIREDSNT